MTPYRLWGNHVNTSGIIPGTPEWYMSQNKAATNSLNWNKSFLFFIVANMGPGEVWFAEVSRLSQLQSRSQQTASHTSKMMYSAVSTEKSVCAHPKCREAFNGSNLASFIPPL